MALWQFWLSLVLVYIRLCPLMSVSAFFCLFLSVSVYFWQFLSASFCFCPFLSVSIPLSVQSCLKYYSSCLKYDWICPNYDWISPKYNWTCPTYDWYWFLCQPYWSGITRSPGLVFICTTELQWILQQCTLIDKPVLPCVGSVCEGGNYETASIVTLWYIYIPVFLHCLILILVVLLCCCSV